jgi:uncharacterized protein (TIGR03435 family)
MRLPVAAAWLLVAVAAAAQDARPAFEVASIKPNDSNSGVSNGGRLTGDRFTATNVTVVQMLRNAYGIQEFQIQGGPGWVGIDRFDITANLPPGSRSDEWPVMLQHLLADRFRLQLHREQRPTDVLALVVARNGFKLMPLDSSRCAPPNPSCGFSATPTQIVARGQSMDQLAARLSRSIGQTVVNETGVSGIFDFKVEWTQDEQFRAPGASASPAIFTALTEQLGLRLQGARAPVEVLVIDAIERPTAD